MIFRYNYKSNDVFYSPNSFYKVYLTAIKKSELKWIVYNVFMLPIIPQKYRDSVIQI